MQRPVHVGLRIKVWLFLLKKFFYKIRLGKWDLICQVCTELVSSAKVSAEPWGWDFNVDVIHVVWGLTKFPATLRAPEAWECGSHTCSVGLNRIFRRKCQLDLVNAVQFCFRCLQWAILVWSSFLLNAGFNNPFTCCKTFLAPSFFGLFVTPFGPCGSVRNANLTNFPPRCFLLTFLQHAEMLAFWNLLFISGLVVKSK